MGRTLERRLTAYLDGADRTDLPENIHTDSVAKEMGYRGGLVYGTTVYAWATPLIVEALGEEWLRNGWAELQVRRPLYAGDDLTIRLEEVEGGTFELSAVCDDGRPRLLGMLGRGTGAWVADHRRSQRLEVEPLPDPRPRITLETAPIGQDLPRLQANALDRHARMFNEATAFERGSLTLDGREIMAPAALTGRMTWYVHAVWDYAGPALHTFSKVQYLDVAAIDEPVSVAGHFRDAFERNGHHHSVTDGIVFGADGHEVALTSHGSIFKVAKQEGRD